jgi:hypothetical protein
MRVFLALVFSVLALAACKPSGQAGPSGPHVDPHALQIEIGRYGVMLQQTGAEDAKELARGLREAVWQYNIQRSQLCARNLFTETTCAPPYEPVWMSEPPNARPTLEQLQQRSAEVGQEVQHFWAVICDDARHRTQDRDERRSICAIE